MKHQIFSILFLLTVLVLASILPAPGQSPRVFRGGYVYTDTVYVDVLDATSTVKAVTVTVGPAEVEINLPTGTVAQDDYFLRYDFANNQLILEQAAGFDGIDIQDDGSSLVGNATQTNFTTGLTVTNAAGVATVAADGDAITDITGGDNIAVSTVGGASEISGPGLITGVAYQDSGADIVTSATLNVTGDLSLTDVGGVPTLDFTESTGNNDYNVVGSRIGKPNVAEVLAYLPFASSVDFPADFSGSVVKAATASTGSVTFTVYNNSTEIGYLNFNIASTATLSATATSFISGDVMKIVAPASQDSTLEDVGINLVGERQ